MNKNFRRSVGMATRVAGAVVPLQRGVARHATDLAYGVTRTAQPVTEDATATSAATTNATTTGTGTGVHNQGVAEPLTPGCTQGPQQRD